VRSERWTLFRLLVRRDVQERYRGSLLGTAWAVVTPLATLLVYAFVFSVVFPARWGGPVADAPAGFVVALFCGLIIYGFFADCATRSPTAILSKASYVKKVVFPLEVLPAVVVGTAACYLGIGFLVLISAQLVLNGGLAVTALSAPLLFLPLIAFGLGVAWLLSALGVYLRDTAQAVLPMVQLLLFLSPVFYPVSALPASIQPWMLLNPLAFPIEQLRGAVLEGRFPDWPGLMLYSGAACVVLVLSYGWFRRVRHGFADVM